MAGPDCGHVPDQIFHEKNSLMFSLSKHGQRILMYIHSHKVETHCTVWAQLWGCDMRLILLFLPFILHKFFQDEGGEWNQKTPLNRKIGPTSLIIPVVIELK